MSVGRDDHVQINLSKVKSGRDILPELHKKTHFKGATTLLTDSREINSYQDNARLRSRFRLLEKSMNKSKSNQANSVSFDLSRKLKRDNFTLFGGDSRIQRDSRRNLLIMGDNSQTSIMTKNKSLVSRKSKGYINNTLNMIKNVDSNSNDVKKEFTIDQIEGSDYGIHKLVPGSSYKTSSVRSKNKNILSKHLHSTKSNGNLLKVNQNPSVRLDSSVGPDSHSADSEMGDHKGGEGHTNISDVTRQVLAQCRVVRRIR